MELETFERWLSVDEIANHLGVAAITIYRWLDGQKIPAHRVGKLWKFKPTEVDAWVTSGGADGMKPKKRKSQIKKASSK